ncbi:hypothetical protein TUBRATIS_13570 [Tubulinosema ratisbonensis]|uniref:Uncharacterized protein n=1 Tax=Tubulinosema ratisbonensis TaxID=291195 RepID=A0A437AM47_9MICR|nr:hypothetical protein TUBRATIS_13570 [Tubulinosema ratisbonensis]
MCFIRLFFAIKIISNTQDNTTDNLDKKEGLEYVKDLIVNLPKKKFITFKPIKISLKTIGIKIPIDKLKRTVKTYKKVFLLLTDKHIDSMKALKFKNPITDRKIIKYLIFYESFKAHQKYIFIINEIFKIFFFNDYEKKNFYNELLNDGLKGDKEFLEFILYEYLYKENVLKSQINTFTPCDYDNILIYAFLKFLSHIQRFYYINPDSYQVYLRYNIYIFNSKKNIFTLNLFFYILNNNIFNSSDFKFLSQFCPEFYILKYIHFTNSRSTSASKTLHYISTLSIFNMRIIFILIFGNFQKFFTLKYIPLYKLEIVNNLKTRLLFFIYSLFQNKNSKISNLIYKQSIESILNAVFCQVNNISLNYNTLTKLQIAKDEINKLNKL